jgi:diguanylate cyclase (GGDEF)-like protein
MVCALHAPEGAFSPLAPTNTIDPLTGLFTARIFWDALADGLAHARHVQQVCTILILDIDHLRAINQDHGPETTDAVLRGIAALLRPLLPSPGQLFRWGGDEFAAILPQTGRTAALSAAEQLRGVLEAHVFTAHGTAVRVTCSIGLSTYPEDLTIYAAAYPHRGAVAADDLHRQRVRLVELCENAVHACKNAGGNTVSAADTIAHW